MNPSIFKADAGENRFWIFHETWITSMLEASKFKIADTASLYFGEIVHVCYGNLSLSAPVTKLYTTDVDISNQFLKQFENVG